MFPDHPSPKQDSDEGYLVENDALIRLGGGSIEKGRAKLRLMLADERERAPRRGPVEKPANVRLATAADEAALLDAFLIGLNEYTARIAPVSRERVTELIESATHRKGTFIPVIDGEHGEIAALTVLVPLKWWWSETLFLEQVVLWVAPGARSNFYSANLLDYSCWLADAMSESSGELMHLVAGISALKRVEAKMRMLGRHMQFIGGYGIYPALDHG
jgi:hypothetical protein